MALIALLVPVAALAALAIVLVGSKATLTASDTALAKLKLPLGGGQVLSVQALVGGRTTSSKDTIVPVQMRSGNLIWPTAKIGTGETVTVSVTFKRPGWISWLTGSKKTIELTLKTPTTKLRSAYLTVKAGQPVALHFRTPVSVVRYGPTQASLTSEPLSKPTAFVDLKTSASAGTMIVAAAPRTWEKPRSQAVSWFPAGAKATAVATPAPGGQLKPDQTITLTFSKTVSQALGTSRPPVSPTTPGTWHTINSHTIKFIPTGYGYGLGADVSVALPAGVQLVGGSGATGQWTVQAGTTTRLQQLLAELGYLPVNFDSDATVPNTISGQENAAIDPPSGSFPWRFPNTPAPLKALWAAGSYGELTKGAVMSFENSMGMDPDGVAGPAVWKALIGAAINGQKSTFGYSYVHVSEGDPENEYTWHNGKTTVTGLVNTGIAAAGGTQTGVFAVFEHVPVTTMSGFNPDGSHYSDPGIPDVSYFNGGDALHGYIRASYGFPQSLGCVEMPYSEAAAVYPYTPIGTIVNVVS